MPAPVSFLVSVAPLPTTFSGTPQQLATAIADRLTVTPVEPWSSFQNGATIPSSDSGPVLYNGQEWRVWNSGTGSYTYLTVNGAGIVASTVPISALANWSATGSLLVSNASKVPTEFPASSTDGQVLVTTTVDGKKTLGWADSFLPTASGDRFEMTLAAATPQSLNVGGVPEVVKFAGTRYDPAGIFDDALFRLPSVTAGNVWFFYAQIHVQKTGTANPWNVQVDITKNGSAVSGLGSFWSGAATVLDGCVNVSGIMLISPGQSYVDVSVTTNATTDTVEILANSTNTRFGGYRIL